MTGPIPLIRPDPRYFSIPTVVAGSTDLNRIYLELVAEFWIVIPFSPEFQHFSGIDSWQISCDGD